MASNGVPVDASVASIVQGSQAPLSISFSAPSGKVLPAGNIAAQPDANVAGSEASAADPTIAHAANSQVQSIPAKAASSANQQPSLRALIAQLNKFLNDSGRPDQYRVDPQSQSTIQEINPSNGAVIGQFAASEFPALARSVGASGLLFDQLA